MEICDRIALALALRRHPTLAGFLIHEAVCGAAEVGAAMGYLALAQRAQQHVAAHVMARATVAAVSAILERTPSGRTAARAVPLVAVMLAARMVAGLGYQMVCHFLRRRRRRHNGSSSSSATRPRTSPPPLPPGVAVGEQVAAVALAA
ncbi:hypothetical protein HYH02_004899 [Chlamydomonas schloesseri]|uniref:Uncharacterized protein n=1 Tax=Chlamydomonas schloesseri TaxID=2026947 RepID=A0A836B7Z0_9CHLO|nr:hypothetical protein HYH02_004899 [Chlamydomonas schloesseri]|eukprot:KAG2450396.1 hypothetical protein HYH02_004899 [Chlamydomonas schloesseri]